MSMASEMRNISECSRDCDTEFNKIYEGFMDKIRSKAKEGLREISWFDLALYYDFKNPNRTKLLQMVDDKLASDGFKHVYGYQIGKPLYNSQSEYVIW